MRRHPFAIVDVFAERPLAGNPLAVVMGADDLDEARMAAVAAEFNLSETTFVSHPTLDGADWRLRSFTPGRKEVSAAGHNALGAWWWLASSGLASTPGATQELGGRVLPVHIGHEADGTPLIGLKQGSVELTPVELDGFALSSALVPDGPIVMGTSPTVVGSVGSPHLLVSLPSISAVDAVRPDHGRLRRVLAAASAQGCYVYTVDVVEHAPRIDAYARFFNPTVGILEDPATGSAAGPLAALLTTRGAAGERVQIMQGRGQGRPSLLRVRVTNRGTTLFGRCALSATGVLNA